jgi:uracil-DNA glycosylase family 4
MSAYIISQDSKILNQLCSDPDVLKNNNFKYRAIGHLINYPKILHYINKYINNWFTIETSNLNELLFTISCICKQHKIDSLNKLYFTKYKIVEESEFVSIINKYYTEFELDLPSNSEIVAYINLYKAGIITDSDINKMNDTILGINKSTPTSNLPQIFIPTTIDSKSDDMTFEKLSFKIKEYCNTIINYKSKCNQCKHCTLYSKDMIVLDTNLQDIGSIDILIIGLNPGIEEIKIGLPFVNNSGMIFRKYLDPLIKKYHLSYAITNCILCTTINSQEIPNISIVSKNCKPIIDEIRRMFPAKLVIVVGNETKNLLNIKGSISKYNGEIIDGYFIIIHPNLVIQNASNLSKFEKAFQNLDIVLSKGNIGTLEQQIQNIEPVDILINIPPEKLITRFTKDLTLFDIKIINEQVIYIMKNTEGQKLYLCEKISSPIYLKQGQYKDCHFIEENVDMVCLLTSEERLKLNKSLYYYNSKKD